MILREGSNSVATPARVTLGPGWGWSRHQIGDAQVAIKGYLFDGSRTLEGESAAAHAAKRLTAASDDRTLVTALADVKGHFAIVIETAGRTLATVDRIRSIPLTFATRSGTTFIDDRARRLRDDLGLGRADIDPDQALAAAMSGYTIGPATLYRGLNSLLPGEALLVDAAGARTLRWYIYDAWQTEEVPNPDKRLSELNRFLMERLSASTGGRTICVPLSAGYDSRFIAAGLKEFGAKDVRLFSYGRAGNHEAETARLIAERLGYPWRFVPFTTATQAAMFADPTHEQALWRDADSCTSVPFEQDWRAIEVLKREGYIPEDSIVVNGQSGDFISGNHAPPELMDLPPDIAQEQRRQRVFKPFLKKHYRLWDALATPGNDAVVERLLIAEAQRAGAYFSENQQLWGICEYLECVNRQSKYVVAGQKAYEALGLHWRLPLWDDELIAFWSRASASMKCKQNLYRRVLETDNWAGAFSGIPVNRKTITPAWIRPVRLAVKLACAPLGRERWHRTERRVFGWWMDGLRMSAVTPYLTAVMDTRGARHGTAWLTERWLAKHGVAWSDLCARMERS